MSRVPLPSQRPLGAIAGDKYYRPSGGVNPAALVLAGLAGAVAAVVMAVPYAYAVKYIPIPKLNALTTLCYGVALGVVPAWMLKRLKVRSAPAGLLVCGLVGLVGLYAAWVVWEALLFTDTGVALRQLAVSPNAVVRLAVSVNEQGTWSMGHSYSSSAQRNADAVSGWLLTLIWAAEAAILIGMSMVVGPSMLKSAPFCDACDAWCSSKGVVRSTATVDGAALRQRLEAGDFAHVATLAPAVAGNGMEFTRHSCDSCNRLHTLTVTQKTIVRDKKGKVVTTKAKVVVDKLLVSGDDLAKLAPPAAP